MKDSLLISDNLSGFSRDIVLWTPLVFFCLTLLWYYVTMIFIVVIIEIGVLLDL